MAKLVARTINSNDRASTCQHLLSLHHEIKPDTITVSRGLGLNSSLHSLAATVNREGLVSGATQTKPSMHLNILNNYILQQLDLQTTTFELERDGAKQHMIYDR